MDGLSGKFIVFDGPDGSGKSTQFSRLEKYLESKIEVVSVREPGGTLIGEKVREILLDPANTEMSSVTEMLLYMSSRAQLIIERILPALDRGALVLADRFVSATFAYQGSAGGLDRKSIEGVAEAACVGVKPDVTILLDVDEKISASRMSRDLDRMEQKDRGYHERVRHGFLEQARRNSDSWIVIDGSRSVDEVWENIKNFIDEFNHCHCASQ